MSRKRKKTEPAKNSGAPVKIEKGSRPAEARELSRRAKIIIIAVAAILAAAIVAGAVFGIIYLIKTSSPLDYINENLGYYVEIAPELYEGLVADVNVRAVSDYDVNLQLYQALASKKGSTLYDGEFRHDKVFNPGDEAKVYLRAYEVLEDGRKVDFKGGCNFAESTATSLEIGSGQSGDLKVIAEENGFSASVGYDLSGHDRRVKLEK